MIPVYEPEHIRNIAIIGHNKTGKTTLVEALLYMGGVIQSQGTVESKNTSSDYMEDEKKRGISIHNSILFIENEGVKINLIDTPGLADFVGDVRASLRVAEGAIVLVDAEEGMQIETEKIWDYANEYGIPRLVFINKMDKEKANFFKILDEMKARFVPQVVAIELPIGQASDFKGVVDLIRMKAIYPESDGTKVRIEDIPSEMMDIAREYRQILAEAVAESDDRLIEKFLNEEPLTEEEVTNGLLDSIKKFKLIPVACGSALKDIGIVTLLRMIIHESPSPVFRNSVMGIAPEKRDDIIERKASIAEPFCAFVFKTKQDQYSGKISYLRVRSGKLTKDTEILNPILNKKEKIAHVYFVNGQELIETDTLVAGDIGVVLKLEDTETGHTLCDPKNPIILPALRLPKPVYSLAISANAKNDEEKLHQILSKTAEEDPTIHVDYNIETRETVVSGMGEFHLRLLLEYIERVGKIKATTNLPQIAYRETILKPAEAKYKHKKQSGGHGQYGEVAIKIAPMERSTGYKFYDEITGGVIPKQYIPGVEKGIEEALLEGVLGSFPVQDVEVHLFDGSFHSVDSSEFSFKMAAISAFKEAMKKANPVLLEPIMAIEILSEKDFIGDIVGDLNGRRGKVLGMDEKKYANMDGSEGRIATKITAEVPLAEMQTFALDLRSMSSGRATFEMNFSHYEVLQGRLAADVLEKKKTAGAN